MIRHNHEERLHAMSKTKRLPKPDGTSAGTHPHDYNLNLATLSLIELSHVDIMHIHDAIHAGTTVHNRKTMAIELMRHLYSLQDHLSSADYAGIYWHINQVINE